MFNEITLIGHLGKDPETFYMPSGDLRTTLTMATNHIYRDHNDRQIEKTQWHRVVSYRTTAQNAAQYLKKGSKVMVKGRLESREWTDEIGELHVIWEVIAQRIIYL